jgi:putative lipoprotein
MDEAPSRIVTGCVVFRQRPTFSPSAVLTVALDDVSLADAPARIISVQTLTPLREPPIPFALHCDPADSIPNHIYAMRARIEEDGRLLFISTRAYHVITRGAPSEIEIEVEPANQARNS